MTSYDNIAQWKYAAMTYSGKAVVPLVHDMSVVLIIQLVGKVGAAAGSTKHSHKTWVVAALLHMSTMHKTTLFQAAFTDTDSVFSL